MDVVAFENRNFETIDALIRKNDISCEWQQMQGCHAFFSKVEFEEAKKDIIELQKRSPVLGSSVRIIENKEELTDLKIPTALGAVVQARAAKLSPYKLVSSILEKLIRTSNLNLQTSTPVLSLTPEISGASSWSVLTSRGSVSASNVIFTTNGYTGYLVSQLQSCIVPVRGEMSALQAPNSLLQQPLSYTYRFIGGSGQTKEQNDYLVQRPVSTDGDGGGELMFGGGRFKALHEGVKVDNDSTIDAPVAEYLRERLLHILDIEESAKVSTESLNKEKELVAKGEWTGIMGFSRDGYPWVGAVPDAPGLWLSAGYNGSGSLFTLSFRTMFALLSLLIMLLGMPNAALSSQHTASLILAASKGKDWRAVERSAVQNGVIPSSYIITKERMEQVRGRFLKL
ncbi:hypothetical protein MMC14_009008 [Varicellaria rhodocarpa]|nr:hypothetical protein [Varicellaria rhodocarpa]